MVVCWVMKHIRVEGGGTGEANGIYEETEYSLKYIAIYFFNGPNVSFFCTGGSRAEISVVRCEGVLESLWKHHESKDLNFLHRNCAPTFFSAPDRCI